jgi:GNAT superfamily N-acetyltransferase
MIKSDIQIREMQGTDDMLDNFGILSTLYPEMQKADYARMLQEMLPNGYHQVAVFEGSRCIGLSGFWINTKLYCGKYIEPDHVVIDPEYRSRGIGKMLCDWIAAEGLKRGCGTALLDAYVENADAHRFYFREGYRIKGFHFLLKLKK